MEKITNYLVISAPRGKESFIVIMRILNFLTIFALAVNCVTWEENNLRTPAAGRLYSSGSIGDNHTIETNGLSNVKSNQKNELIATGQTPPTNSPSYLPGTGTPWKLKSKTLNRNPRKLAETKIRRRRVVGGRNANPHEFPFQVLFIRPAGDVWCGGTILDENFILTAAHCLYEDDRYKYDAEEFESWTVVAGDHNGQIDEGTEQRRRIRDVHIHEKYIPISEVNDIAIVRLDRPLQLTRAVQPILLPPRDYEASGDAIVTGWGKLKFNGTNPLVLQKVTVPIVDRAYCVKAYEEKQVFVSVKMMCAGDVVDGGVDACSGDEGGPLSVKLSNGSFMLVGVVSGGIGCGRAEYPGIYTEVSKYVDWIYDTINNFENCSRRERCHYRGTCLNGNNSFHCICLKGYEGLDCTSVTNNCEPSNPCLNGGTCVNKINSFSCICEIEFTGTFCEQTNKCEYPGTCAPPISNAGKCDRCRDGFVKDPEEGTACKYVNLNASLIISSRASIKIISLDGQDTDQMIQSKDFVSATDYSFQTNTIFWFSNSNSTIYKFLIHGNPGKQNILHDTLSDINGIAVDWVYHHIYWVDKGKFQLGVSNFDGTMKKVLFNDGLLNPTSIVVNPLNGWMYWVDEGKNRIERAGLDGSQREVILNTNIKEPQSIIVNFVDNRLYWSQGWYSSSIWSSDFDGSNSKIIFQAKPSQFFHSYFLKIATFDKFLYFAEYYSKTIYKVDKCNGEDLEMVYKSHSRLWDFKIYDLTLQPKGQNFCLKRIGHFCSHFCFPVPSVGNGSVTTTMCACPEGLSLSMDQQNCV